jgi:hypothetical protein
MNKKTLWNVSQTSFLENKSYCLEKMEIVGLNFINLLKWF